VNALRHYLLALQFFTRIPLTGAIGRWLDYSPQRMRASAGHYPGVGLLVGALTAGVYAALALGLPPVGWTPLVAAVLSTIASALITGAFHEDGLADVADGLGGAYQRERALEIMKDSRIGSFGALALVLALLAKLSLLALLGSVHWLLACAALVLAHALSRAWPLLMIRLLPHVGDLGSSKSKPLADSVAWTSLLAGAAWVALTIAALMLGGLLGAQAVALATLVSGLAFFVCWQRFRSRLGGFTGDCLGATQQVCEIACYLGLALAL